jgi:hypothetical protein
MRVVVVYQLLRTRTLMKYSFMIHEEEWVKFDIGKWGCGSEL